MKSLSKVISIFICIFLIQTLGSCLWRCDDPKSYSVSYESVDVNTFDTSGFHLEDSDSALFKNAFAIIINLQTKETEIDDYRIAASIGFNSAQALSCEDPYFYYDDKISDIQIVRIDENGTEINMTSSFSREDYNGNRVGITDMVQEMKDYQYYQNDSFHVELYDYNDLPDVFKLRVEVSLESGTIFSQETDTLYFVD